MTDVEKLIERLEDEAYLQEYAVNGLYKLTPLMREAAAMLRTLAAEKARYERHEQSLRDNGINGHAEAIALVTLLRAEKARVEDELKEAELWRKSDLKHMEIYRRTNDALRAKLEKAREGLRAISEKYYDWATAKEKARATLEEIKDG